MKFYETIFHITPKGYRRWIRKHLEYANFSIDPEKYVGFTFFFSIIFGIMIALLLLLFDFSMKLVILSALSTFLLFQAIPHFLLIMVADRIAKFTDKILPDALRLVSANIRSGLTPDKALLLAARSEFGPLKDQILMSAKLTLSGESIENALKEIPKRINSKALKRSIDLLVEGIIHGGSLAHLLDGLANDIRQTETMKRDVHAFVMMYAIFIFLAAGIGAPLLYGISSYLVETMAKMTATTPVQSIATANIKFMPFKGMHIKSEFLTLYNFLALSITSIFGGILIGLIQEGSEKGGLKYIPLLFVLSIGIYFISRMLAIGIFGTIVK